jgi:hypothetical protein
MPRATYRGFVVSGGLSVGLSRHRGVTVLSPRGSPDEKRLRATGRLVRPCPRVRAPSLPSPASGGGEITGNADPGNHPLPAACHPVTSDISCAGGASPDRRGKPRACADGESPEPIPLSCGQFQQYPSPACGGGQGGGRFRSGRRGNQTDGQRRNRDRSSAATTVEVSADWYCSMWPSTPGKHMPAKHAGRAHAWRIIFAAMPAQSKSPADGPGSGFCARKRLRLQAASSSSAGSSPSAALPRRGPLASAASISLTASVSVMRWTAEISRDSRSRAAS